MLLALAFRRPLLVRYCGNWHVQRTLAERLWHLLMEHFAGDRNVMLATGGMVEPPSPRNPSIRWVFSTSLWQSELEAYGRHHRSLAKDQLRLVIACRQEKGKGVETVIDALPIVQARFPQVTLDIIGDGTALVNLKERAKARGLEKRVHFHGRITHDAVISQLRQSDVFCFPTASEGFPKAVLEALACGLPVIATRVSVLPQLLGEGCGFLLDSVSPESLADAVLECASDHSRYEVMSGLALRAARRYSLESWRDLIGGWLTEAWGPLRRHV